MKVLGICCGRKNGNTEILMKEDFKAIEDKDAVKLPELVKE